MIFFRDSHFFVDAIITEPGQLPELIRAHITRLLSSIAIAVTVLAAFDIAWSRIHWRNELRMTRQEIKDEHKQAEGDPLLKSRLRSLSRDRARQRMIASVPTATLIVANPTHFSVALRYNPAKDPAPVVVAKGQDIIALKIRESRRGTRRADFRECPVGAVTLQAGAGQSRDRAGILQGGRRS